MNSYGSGSDESYDESLDIEALLQRAIDTVDTAKSMPLSASVILPRDEIRGVLEACLENLPLEIRQANWMLRERAEFLAKMQREGDEILQTARDRAERMVSRSELVKEAQRTAQRTVTEADDESRRLRHEADDYVDSKLAAFEDLLERTWRTVSAGRDKLRGEPVVELDAGDDSASVTRLAVFDQERR